MVWQRRVAAALLLLACAAAAGSAGEAGLGVPRSAAGAAVPNGLAQNGSSSSSGPGSASSSRWAELWAGTSSTGAPSKKKDKAQVLAELRAENEWKNSLVLWVLPQEIRNQMPMVVQVSGSGR